MASRFLEALDERDARPLRALPVDVALASRVAEAQLDRVDVQLLRQLVHRRFEREISLWRSWCAVRLDGRLVGRHLVAGDVHRGPAIRAGEERARDAAVPAGARAVVVAERRPQRGQGPVLLRADLDLES